jgi:hypothetical protein
MKNMPTSGKSTCQKLKHLEKELAINSSVGRRLCYSESLEKDDDVGDGSGYHGCHCAPLYCEQVIAREGLAVLDPAYGMLYLYQLPNIENRLCFEECTSSLCLNVVFSLALD